MTASKIYKVRQSPHKDPKNTFQIFLSPADFVQKFKIGGICNLETAQGVLGPAITCQWQSPADLKEDIVQVSKDLQLAYGVKLESRVNVSPSKEVIADAEVVALCEVDPNNTGNQINTEPEADRVGWAWVAAFYLQKTEIVGPGLVLHNVQSHGQKKSFRVQKINHSDRPALYRVQSNIRFLVTNTVHQDENHQTLSVSDEEVGGLSTQLKQINEEVDDYNYPVKSIFPDLLRACDGGIILHGASGTGKSLILRKISEACWRGVFRLDKEVLGNKVEENKNAIAQIFSNALRCQPSLIVLDSLETIAGKTDSVLHSSMGPFLSQQLERLSNSRTLAIAATRKLSDIDPDLRAAGHFISEIEIPIPDSKSRAEILKVLAGIRKDKTHPTLDNVAARTHGFVGADLKVLLRRTARSLLRNERRQLRCSEEYGRASESDPETLLANKDQEFESFRSRIRPSAMQEIFVETPDVRWADIGGQHEAKKVLEKALIWPIKYPEIMAKHGLKPKRGLLMYGPPGCSKTMTAKAAAKESGLNFIAVKGPELTSMYVGESERALREVFRKARAVRPSIIFFDEIDAIGAASGLGQHGGVQTVTTLLNELDGFQTTEGVFVLGATNRPEVLDRALIRAGRLDTTLYVGLPNDAARREILRKNILTMRIGDDVDVNVLSIRTQGFSGAEIVQICEEAGSATVEAEVESQQDHMVSQKNFEAAIARVERSVTPKMVEQYMAWGAARH